MKVRYYIFVLMTMLMQGRTGFAQYEFVANHGQWHDNVRYKMNLNDGALFLEDNCLTYTFFKHDDLSYSMAHHGSEVPAKSLIRHAHAYKVHFAKSNKNVKPVPSASTNDYCNFYIGNDKSKWAAKVPKYHDVRYPNLYNSVDVHFYTSEAGLKYDFVVHAGAKLKDIALTYEGVDKMYVQNGDLYIVTSVNTVVESRPYAYQLINGDSLPIQCNYVLNRNSVRFDVAENYNPHYDLIIDPSLVFSTYTGSTGDNWGFTATWDYSDNVYSGGIVFDVGYPTSTGAYQVDYASGSNNGCDIGIIKYNPTGTQRLFATYLGGGLGQEMPHSLVVTQKNELVIMGTTGSVDFPVTAGAFQTTFAGGDTVVYDNIIGFNGVDIFVAKLSADGSQLLGSTYVGGSGNDGLNFKMYYTYPDPVYHRNIVEMHGNDSLYNNYADGARGEVMIDESNMIYVGTNTFSTDFPAGVNPGFQTTSGGKQDGIVFKFNPDLSELLWSSYLGGSEDDAIFSLSLTSQGDVLVAGGTVSHNFPTTAAAYNPTFNGGSTDGFVSKLNPHGNFLLASTYFGSNVYDNAYFVRTDQHDNIFICGQTKASGNTLIHNALYNIPNSGQFITKFDNSLQNCIWSTVFGTGNGRPNISITAFAVDVCNRVYLTGWGREWAFNYYTLEGDYYTWESTFGTKGMQVTADALQSTTDGQDFYVMVLNEDASALEYASFFGEQHYASCGYSGRDHVDGGTSRFDKKGHIIQSVCASCGGCQQFPIAPANAWSSVNNSTNCNNAVFKIRIIEHLAEANFDPVPAGCVPYTVNFNNTSQGSTYHWDFGDGTTSDAFNPVHTYDVGGEYTVRLVVNDPLSCNYNDTIYRTVNVIEPGTSVLPDITICPNTSTIIGPENEYPDGTTFSWTGDRLSNNNIQNPIATPAVTTQYVLIASGICDDVLTQNVIVYEPNIDLFVSNDTMICEGGTAHLSAHATEDVDTWEWSDNYNFSNIIATQPTVDVSPSANAVYHVRIREEVCNTVIVRHTRVNVHAFNYDMPPEQIVCAGDTTELLFVNQNPNDVLTYSWQPAAAIVAGETTAAPSVAPANDITYHVTVTNQMGCTTHDETRVHVDKLTVAAAPVDQNLCHGDCLASAVAAANGIAPYHYSWDNNQVGDTAIGLCAGNYVVTAVDDHGCTAKTHIDIGEPTPILSSFTNIQQPECDGVGYGSATVVANGGTPQYTYQWGYGADNQTVNNSCLTGFNYVTITDANGCRHVDSVMMNPPSLLSIASDAARMVSCYGFCDGSVAVSATMGEPPYNYMWSNHASGDSLYGLCADTYVVTVVDAVNCVIHDLFVITQPDTLVTTTAVTTGIKCFGELGAIASNTVGGVPPYTYLWSNDVAANAIGRIPAGTYTITVTDDHGCVATSTINLEQPEALRLEALVTNMPCNYICKGSIATNAGGGTPPYRYSWSNGFNSQLNDHLCAGDYNVRLTDANGCRFEKTFTVANDGYVPDLTVTASKNEIFEGESVALHAASSRSGTFVWDNRKVLNHNDIADPIATPKSETLFEVVFTDSIGCRNSDTIRIKVKDVDCDDTYIFVPNAFTPNGDGNNDLFKPYFPPELVTEVYFAVFDRWGAILFESDDLYMQGWNGTFKNQPLATDVYVFFLRVKCLNNSEYEHKGNVTLLR